jgi:hypothetical protein
MDSAWVGGAALLTNYFHSCFLSEFHGEAVSHRSGSSFFGIFSKGHGGGQGSNISQVLAAFTPTFTPTLSSTLPSALTFTLHPCSSQTLWDQWSTEELILIGGAANKHGKLTKNNTLSEKDCDEWEESIKDNAFVPLKYHMIALSEFMFDAGMNKAKAANVNRSIFEYIGDVRDQSDQLVNHLVPQDPYIKPAWCHYSPHPVPPNPRQGMYSCAPGHCIADPWGTYAVNNCAGQCKKKGEGANPGSYHGGHQPEERPKNGVYTKKGWGDLPGCPPLPTKAEFMKEARRRQAEKAARN